MNTFGNRLRSLLEEHDMEGKDFAKFMHVQPPTVSNWLNGNRFPKEDFIIKISEFFNVSTDYLLGRTDKKNPLTNESSTYIYEKFASEIADVIEKKGLEYTEDLLEEILNFTEYLVEKKKKQDK